MKIAIFLIALIYAGSGIAQTNMSDDGINVLDYYVGHWISDTKDFQGKSGHFTYDLSWFDKSKTIIKMTIMQEFDSGTSILLWSGFKGWHPNNKEIYYYGYSTGGQFCHGNVQEVDGELITEYDAIASSGLITRVKDVFVKKDEKNFNSKTFIVKDNKWMEVTQDIWARAAVTK